MIDISPLRYQPYPEIVEDGEGASPYEVIDSLHEPGLPSTGMVNLVGRQIFVPFDGDGQSTRRHELAHVKWSPAAFPKIEFARAVLLAVEDARINMAMARVKLPVRLSAKEKKLVSRLAAADLKSGDFAGFILRVIASLGTDGLTSVLAPARESFPDHHDLAVRLMNLVRTRLRASQRRNRGEPVAAFAAAVACAREVARELHAQGFKVSESLVICIAGLGCGGCAGKPARFGAAGRLVANRCGRAAKFGALSVVEAPLEHARACVRAAASARRASTEGAIVRAPNRWFGDKAIFVRRTRRRGGAVLVDASGSMRLSVDDIDRMVRVAAAAVVAMYSGADSRGEVRIVARDGRRASVASLVPYGHGNIVDLPALQWLAKQDGPRLWISDGKVTGCHDETSEQLAAACRAFCQRHDIRRVETAEAAARLLGLAAYGGGSLH
jgi:hypothetical protein